LDAFSTFTQNQLERIISSVKDESAENICGAIIEGRQKIVEQSDDLSLVVIKRN
jgi:hypothetical protein